MPDQPPDWGHSPPDPSSGPGNKNMNDQIREIIQRSHDVQRALRAAGFPGTARGIGEARRRLISTRGSGLPTRQDYDRLAYLIARAEIRLG